MARLTGTKVGGRYERLAMAATGGRGGYKKNETSVNGTPVPNKPTVSVDVKHHFNQLTVSLGKNSPGRLT